ncbi:hypothetical protein PN460_08265, partial [Nodularia sphaerocarpa CS-585A2]|nr:hypothetical protein [Nodularia sphaerocarpa CS-585A2]
FWSSFVGRWFGLGNFLVIGVGNFLVFGDSWLGFFFVEATGEVLINEINTFPGFTATSMYPQLWAYSGIPFPELVDRLIQLALERYSGHESQS